MEERIKKLRKALGLTQQDFAERIGSSQGVITNYEAGRRNPSGSAINNICKEFSVNETWLRTGEGEMFINIPRDKEIASFVGRVLQTESDSFKKRFVSMLAQLSEAEWGHLEHYAHKLAAPPEQTGEQLTIDEEVEAYRQELEAERKGATLPPSDASGA